jgi:hypothetical protein
MPDPLFVSRVNRLLNYRSFPFDTYDLSIQNIADLSELTGCGTNVLDLNQHRTLHELQSKRALAAGRINELLPTALRTNKYEVRVSLVVIRSVLLHSLRCLPSRALMKVIRNEVQLSWRLLRFQPWSDLVLRLKKRTANAQSSCKPMIVALP